MEYSKFFNAVEIAPGVYDRVYEESDFADYFGSVLSTGLLHHNNIPGLEVTVESNTLNTVVAPGKAIIKGHLYENTAPLTLTHNMPEVQFNRIDRIVLRMDSRNQARYIRLFVKEGSPSAQPVPPDLQRDAFIYELGLAEVTIRANTASIRTDDVVDTRLSDSLAGLTYSLMSGPLGDLTANVVRLLDEKNFYNIKSVEGALKELKTPLSIYRSGLDANGVYTIYEERDNGVTVRRSVLTNPDANGNYQTQTVSFYNGTGTVVKRKEIWSISYNADGNPISEALTSSTIEVI